jgi:ribosomal protein S18 acetylase RimI-like enzyme
MLTYELAHVEQIDEFLRLMREDAVDYLDRTMELMQMTWSQFDQLVKTVGQVFGIYHDGLLVGFYWVEERDRVVHLHGLVIRNPCQGQGMGTEVLNMLANRYADTMDAIELGVHESNTRAQALYARLGYQTTKHLADLAFLSYSAHCHRNMRLMYSLSSSVDGVRPNQSLQRIGLRPRPATELRRWASPRRHLDA